MLEFLWLPFLACLVLTGIHVYLGLHVLARGIIFVDLALAQMAALTGRMKNSGVRLIIAEPSTSASLVAQVAARAEARAVILVPSVGGDPAARDYLSLFDVNVARLAAVLAAAPAAR